MNPLQILTLAIPVIEAMPSVAKSIEALISAVEAMVARGANVNDAVNVVRDSLPQVTAAVVANTPAATPVPAPPSPPTSTNLGVA